MAAGAAAEALLECGSLLPLFSERPLETEGTIDADLQPRTGTWELFR
jgi:hypothetical protein